MATEIKTLKDELEAIVPAELVEKSKAIHDNLVATLADHQNIHAKISVISEKVAKAKKELSDDIEQLTQNKITLIKETTQLINDRADKAKLLEDEYRRKEISIESLNSTITDLSVKIRVTQSNLDALVNEKNKLDYTISDGMNYLNQIHTEQKNVKFDVEVINSKKQQAIEELNKVQNDLEDAKRALQTKNNEVMVAQSRLDSLNK